MTVAKFDRDFHIITTRLTYIALNPTTDKAFKFYLHGRSVENIYSFSLTIKHAQIDKR